MDIVRGAIASALENVEGSEEFKALDGEQAAAPAEEKAEQEFGSVSTDKGILHWDGDAALKVGDSVRMVAEDGSQIEAANDTYSTESHTIVVEGGIVRSIEELAVKAAEEAAPAAEPAEPAAPAEGEQEHAAQEKPQGDAVAEMLARFAQSFEDKYRAIYAALAEAGLDAYIVEAGDTFAVVEAWTGDGYKFFRYALSFAEDGKVTLGERVEVFPTFATAEEKAEIESKYSAMEAELTEVKAALEKAKGKPAVSPAHERYNSLDGRKHRTGEEIMDAVSSVLDAK